MNNELYGIINRPKITHDLLTVILVRGRITLKVGDDFDNITERIYLRLIVKVQNGIEIYGNSGLDPKLAGGINENIYPGPVQR